MKYLFVALLAVLLVEATLAKKNKKSSSSSSSSSSEEKKGKKTSMPCPACPPPKAVIVKEVAVCDGDTRLLQCPPGYGINVVDAFYGRRDRITCSHERMDDVNCSDRDALTIMKSRCDNAEDCEVPSDHNNWFTDPCQQTYKYLEVGFSCEPKTRQG